MTYEERLQIAKTSDDIEELFMSAKEVLYNEFDMLIAIASNPNSNPEIRHILLDKWARFEEVHEAIYKGLLDSNDLQYVVRILKENTYDWFEEPWEAVKKALITGENMEQLKKEESLSFIFDYKYPGYDEDNKYWYIPY